LLSSNSTVEARPHIEPTDVSQALAAADHSDLDCHGEDQLVLQQIYLPHAEALSNISPWVASASRRCFDILIAAIAVVISLPPILLLMLLVRASSPGPAIFRQRRAGRHRKEFTLYKIRSMRLASTGPEITVSGDSRITRIGAVLRRYKLDELPQFWNVLKGNVSLVGPRPKLPHHEALELPYRPGITGMATLFFHDEEKILSEIPPHQLETFYEACIKPRKAQLDLEYMQTATLWTDLKLLWQTATSPFLDKG
jgi:lipopolysaccharide/colanic/teichoic acid biosynthesis glycosyltransferase